ncbi:MAG: OsmC family protein [Thiolinea sp.]
MSELAVDLVWERNTEALINGQIENAHEVHYNSLYRVKADAAPSWGGAVENTNPEQALAAAVSSCHMMTFLSLAAKSEWPVKTYRDHASATLGKNSKGRMCVTALELRPEVTFDEGFEVTAEKLAQMQDRAHRYCFVANSLSDEVSVRVLT